MGFHGTTLWLQSTLKLIKRINDRNEDENQMLNPQGKWIPRGSTCLSSSIPMFTQKTWRSLGKWILGKCRFYIICRQRPILKDAKLLVLTGISMRSFLSQSLSSLQFFCSCPIVSEDFWNAPLSVIRQTVVPSYLLLSKLFASTWMHYKVGSIFFHSKFWKTWICPCSFIIFAG